MRGNPFCPPVFDSLEYGGRGGGGKLLPPEGTATRELLPLTCNLTSPPASGPQRCRVITCELVSATSIT